LAQNYLQEDLADSVVWSELKLNIFREKRMQNLALTTNELLGTLVV